MTKDAHDKTSIEVLSRKCERALLIIMHFPKMQRRDVVDHLAELSSLVDTMGIPVVGQMIFNVKTPQARYMIGKGQVESMLDKAQELDVDLIIFDDDLSPSQQRNLEKDSGITIIDRHEVILDIFADRASTREAVLQVGLARMNYSLPRLTRAWTHLSRQRGGAKGNRGEGETQLEVDKRIVLRKITRLKQELKKVQSQRATRRKSRQEKPVPTAAIVGYTNAGKSSLLHVFTKAEILIENKLFATLDPTTRRIVLDDNQELLLTDTVGFIRKLPHDLVDAFKSTLEETVLADFLIHVLDVSNAEVEQHHSATLAVLKELGADDKPQITVFNKMDLLDDDKGVAWLEDLFPESLFISTKSGLGLDDLKVHMAKLLAENLSTVTFSFPADRHDLVAFLHRNASVEEKVYHDNRIDVTSKVSSKVENKLKEFVVD